MEQSDAQPAVLDQENLALRKVLSCMYKTIRYVNCCSVLEDFLCTPTSAHDLHTYVRTYVSQT